MYILFRISFFKNLNEGCMPSVIQCVRHRYALLTHVGYIEVMGLEARTYTSKRRICNVELYYGPVRER